jgi:hypothetical protein
VAQMTRTGEPARQAKHMAAQLLGAVEQPSLTPSARREGTSHRA